GIGIGGIGGPGGFGGFNPFGMAGGGDSRLGASLSKPNAAIVDQLDLPKGQGLVVGEVRADSAAAQAGLKNNDILLALAGKPVPNEPADFAHMIKDIKPKEAVDVVVLRKGKKETIKGLTLPEAAAAKPPFGIGIQPGGGGFPGGGFPAFPMP